MAHIKGSEKAKLAGKKAAETRAYNKANNANKVVKNSIKVKTFVLKKIKLEDYHQVEIDSPVTLFINKKMNTMYITPNRTKIVS